MRDEDWIVMHSQYNTNVYEFKKWVKCLFKRIIGSILKITNLTLDKRVMNP